MKKKQFLVLLLSFMLIFTMMPVSVFAADVGGESQETSPITLGSRVKKLRQEMNLTQAEVADALHVTPGYISNVENNRTAMSLRILIYYAKLMNTTLDSLVGSLEPAYKENALDNEVMHLVAQMNDLEKQKLINTLRIWI